MAETKLEFCDVCGLEKVQEYVGIGVDMRPQSLMMGCPNHCENLSALQLMQRIKELRGEKYELQERVRVLQEKGIFQIRFDGPPGPVSGRFVEVEDQYGASIPIGDWVKEDDGTWLLHVDTSRRR